MARDVAVRGGLAIKDLHVTFTAGSRSVLAVRGISFMVEPGESVAMVGESGSGKSVTALSVLGLHGAVGVSVSGSILFNGTDLLRLDARSLRAVRGRDVAMVFQDPLSSLDPVMTIGEQVVQSLTVRGALSNADARAKAVQLLAAVGIPEPARRARQYPHEMSGGMRQRVMIAGALAADPALLIADEPTTALDVTIQAQILELLLDLRSRFGMAILLITHDLGVAAAVADRIVVMYAGRIVESGPTADLLEHPAHPYTDGLLAAIPRIDQEPDATLVPIAGSPPESRSDPLGCAFAPRCPVVFARCHVERPPLLRVSDSRDSACWRVEQPA